MFKKVIRKTIPIFLSLIFLFQSISAEAFSPESYRTEEELRLAVQGDARWLGQFPNGLFNFLGTQFEVGENNRYLEIAVVRQGGTEGCVSVDFKAIDISAEYGEDYVIRVYENARKNELKKNDAAIPLIETDGNSATVNISETADKDTESLDSAESGTGQNEADVCTGGGIEIEPGALEDSYVELPKSEVAFGEGQDGHIGQVNSLRQAREAYLGTKSDRPDWKTVDEESVEKIKAEYDRFLYNMPGTETTLVFEDGEYIKYLYIVPLNDSLSESEEQIMLALANPEGGAKRGEFYMGYVNIKDDEEPEKALFEITTPAVAAKDGKAEITVRRTTGIHQYSSVDIGTEAGTALTGIDYEPGLAELFFTPGMVEQKVFVNILNNSGRGEERQFTVALDRTSDKVNLSAAEAVVTLPAIKIGQEIEEGLRVSNRQMLADSSVPQNTNAERLTSYGFAVERGKWRISGDDYKNAGKLDFPNGIQPHYIDEGLYYDYTPSATAPEAVSQAAVYNFDSLGGVEKLTFIYGNTGAGQTVAGKKTYQYQGNLSMWYLKNGIMSYDINNIYGKYGQVPNPMTFVSGSLNDSKWIGTSRISLDTSATKGNGTKPLFCDITLYLKEYAIDIGDPLKIQRKKYTITDSVLSKGTLYKEYSPGRLYVKNIYSNVDNFQDAPTAPKAFRSDFIEFGYEYSADNPDGRYAQYTGFEIQNGSAWIPFTGTELAMDANFFKKNGIFNAIKNGTIKIRPTFAKRPAFFGILFFDRANGWLKNAKEGGTASLNFDNLYSDYSKADIYTGDVFEGLEAKAYYITRLPAWSSGVYNYTSGIFDDAPDSIEVTETGANTKINYYLESPYSTLNLGFRTSTLSVEAQPNAYKHGITQPEYKLDGMAYDRTGFTAEMERVYLYGDPGADPPPAAPVNDNPLLEMEFNYVFASSFPYPQRQEEFGTPVKAILKVYKEDGEQRASYDIPYEGGSFTFSGRPKELGWELDDYASLVVVGSRKLRTQEVTIDFLSNSRDGVIVIPPSSDANPAARVGDLQSPIRIENTNPLEYYNLQAVTSPNTLARWMDASPDLNGDGQIDDSEENTMNNLFKALGSNFWELWDQNIYWGNYFKYRPGTFNNSKIYYSFEKSPENTSASYDVVVSLFERFSTVLSNNGKAADAKSLSNRIPIADAEVYIGAKPMRYEAGTKGGRYMDSDPLYQWGDYYLGQLFFGGEVYNFAARGGIAQEHEFITSDLMRPYDFKAFIQEGSTRKDMALDAVNTSLDVTDGKTILTYKMDASKAGITPNESIIRIYEDVNYSKLFLEVPTGKPVNGEFSYTLNTYQEGIKPGYTMSVAGVLTDEATGKVLHEYPEVRVGLVFHKPLTSLTALASFKTPITPVLSMIGKLNNNYDLGMDVKLTGVKPELYTDSDGFTRKRRTVVFGFSDEYVKEFKKNSEATGDEEKKGNDEELKEETENKSKGEVSKKVAEDTKEAKAAAAKSHSGGGDFRMPYTISLALCLEAGQIYNEATGLYSDDGFDYFSSLVIMATATANYSKSNTFMTPVGIPVTVELSAGGTAVATLAFEADHKNPYADKYKFDGNANVSLNPANYDTYAKFMLAPTVTLSAGSGFDYINLKISGTADFDFQFTVPIFGNATHSAGSGGLTISAKLKLEVLYVQKSWTLYKSQYINLFKYGMDRMGETGMKDAIYSALNDPYRDYLYEAVGAVSDSDVMPRDYLSQEDDWDGEDVLYKVREGNEDILQTGVFPNPQTKLIKLDEERTLLLFIYDDVNRDARNRASLHYTILKEGVAAAHPVAVDADETWDEAPDVFIVGDRVLVTWSDAGRSFTPEDTQLDILSAMNISGAWFDPQTESFGTPFEITRTVADGDGFADLKPRISYDPGTGRLMVYYTKTDYADRWEVGELLTDGETLPHAETPDLLYGDIVNGYSVIAYRFAEFDAGTGRFVWNESYAPEEGLSEEQYYGQRFLALAPPADIEETEVCVEDETIILGEEADAKTIILGHISTSQVVKEYSGLQDPRVVATDLTTHDGRAVFAYILDRDSDLKTPGDQQLYIQTYSYADKTFSYPIEIAGNEVQDTQPQFVYADGVTWLYWLRDGEIVYTCVDEILENLKEVTVSGKTFNIIDKNGRTKDFHILTAVAHENSIDEYHIASNGNSIYLMWTEDGSRKSELKPGDEGADDPESHVSERQIFAACAVPGEGEQHFPWSEPVQVTSTPEQSFSDLSFIVQSDDVFIAAYARYMQQYDAAEGCFTDGNSVRTLAVNTFAITNELEVGEVAAEGLPTAPKAGETVYVTADVRNTGLRPSEKQWIQFYATADGTPLHESEWEQEAQDRGYIPGGGSERVYGSFIMPEDLSGVNTIKAGFRIKRETGELLTYNEVEIPVKADLQLHILESRLTGDDQARVIIYAKNAGNKPFDDLFSVNAGKSSVYNRKIRLAAGEERTLTADFPLGEAQFSELSPGEDGGKFDTLDLLCKFGEFEAGGTVKREVSAEEAGRMEKVGSFSVIKEDVAYKNGDRLSIGLDALAVLQPEIVRQNAGREEKLTQEQLEAEGLRVEWQSSDPEVAAISPKGLLIPRKNGTATVTGILQPVREHSVSYTDGTFDNKNDSYTLPDGIKKKITLMVEIGTDSGGSGEEPVPVNPGTNAVVTDLGDQAKDIFAGDKNVSVAISAVPGAKAYTLAMPADALAGPYGKASLTAVTALGSLLIRAGMFAEMPEASGKTAEVTLAEGERTNLSEEVKAAIGSRPVIQLSLALDGKPVDWKNPGAPVTVSIPYKPSKEELNSPESIVIWHIDGSGKAVPVPNGHYDAAAGAVIFTTAHFGCYAVGYNKVSFGDVAADAWYRRAVEFIAAREITAGTGGGKFSPGARLTRGQFITMLMKAYGIVPDAGIRPEENFSDAGTTYYTAYLAAAKRLGISQGVGNNRFAPEKEMTRQEMFMLIYNTLKAVNGLPQPQENFGKPLSAFSDAAQLKDWAREGTALLTEAGIISGNNGKLSPDGVAARAEMAQVLYNLVVK